MDDPNAKPARDSLDHWLDELKRAVRKGKRPQSCKQREATWRAIAERVAAGAPIRKLR